VAPLILLDAYPIVAYLVDEPAAGEVQALLDRGQALATSVNLAEAIDVACRVHGLSEQLVRDAVELLAAADLLTVTAPDAAVAIKAARLRIAYYRRRERPLSIADCFLLATAGAGDSVATADPAIAEVARSESIQLLPLPDSSGHRP
jgi:predicted nucleic acid-binding protein